MLNLSWTNTLFRWKVSGLHSRSDVCVLSASPSLAGVSQLAWWWVVQPYELSHGSRRHQSLIFWSDSSHSPLPPAENCYSIKCLAWIKRRWFTGMRHVRNSPQHCIDLRECPEGVVQTRAEDNAFTNDESVNWLVFKRSQVMPWNVLFYVRIVENVLFQLIYLPEHKNIQFIFNLKEFFTVTGAGTKAFVWRSVPVITTD